MGFFYTVENKPISAAYAKKGAYVGENRKLDSRFGVKGFQEFAATNAAAPTAPLQIIMLVLDVIAYRKWNFRVMDVSRAFRMSEPLKRDTYVKLSDVVEKDNVAWWILKPMYGVITSRKGWCETILDFPEKECGRGGQPP